MGHGINGVGNGSNGNGNGVGALNANLISLTKGKGPNKSINLNSDADSTNLSAHVKSTNGSANADSTNLSAHANSTKKRLPFVVNKESFGRRRTEARNLAKPQHLAKKAARQERIEAERLATEKRIETRRAQQKILTKARALKAAEDTTILSFRVEGRARDSQGPNANSADKPLSLGQSQSLARQEQREADRLTKDRVEARATKREARSEERNLNLTRSLVAAKNTTDLNLGVRGREGPGDGHGPSSRQASSTSGLLTGASNGKLGNPSTQETLARFAKFKREHFGDTNSLFTDQPKFTVSG